MEVTFDCVIWALDAAADEGSMKASIQVRERETEKAKMKRDNG